MHDFIVNAEWDFPSLQIVSHVSRNAATAEKPLINTKVRLKWRILLCFTRFTDIFLFFRLYDNIVCNNRILRVFDGDCSQAARTNDCVACHASSRLCMSCVFIVELVVERRNEPIQPPDCRCLRCPLGIATPLSPNYVGI